MGTQEIATAYRAIISELNGDKTSVMLLCAELMNKSKVSDWVNCRVKGRKGKLNTKTGDIVLGDHVTNVYELRRAVHGCR